MKNLVIFLVLIFGHTSLFSNPTTDSTFIETDITLTTSTGEIHGSLTTSNKANRTPLVLIIASSGPTDRNGNSAMGLQTNTYKLLSEDLAKKGISSLRFDKRAIGQSRPAANDEADLRFETYIKDVVDWISLLKAYKQFSEIIPLGHSEGSLIGMIAAQTTDIDGYISISGPGQSADKILQTQLKGQLPTQLQDESNKILKSLRQGQTVSDINPNFAALYRLSVQPYLISWMKYDPAQEISNLSIPVLIIQGTTDLQVPLEDAKLLLAAKPDAEFIVIENMNHVLKDSDNDIQKNMATYSNPDLPLKEGIVDAIVNFIKNKITI